MSKPTVCFGTLIETAGALGMTVGPWAYRAKRQAEFEMTTTNRQQALVIQYVCIMTHAVRMGVDVQYGRNNNLNK